MASSLTKDIEKNQGNIDQQLKNILDLLNKMQSTSGEVIGQTNKTTKQFGDIQNKINALNKALTSPKIPKAIANVEKFIDSLKKNRDSQVKLAEFTEKNENQLNKKIHSLTSLDGLVPLLRQQAQLNLSSSPAMVLNISIDVIVCS